MPEKEEIQCKICGMKFTSYPELGLHLRDDHKVDLELYKEVAGIDKSISLEPVE